LIPIASTRAPDRSPHALIAWTAMFAVLAGGVTLLALKAEAVLALVFGMGFVVLFIALLNRAAIRQRARALQSRS
jgi:cyanate permease